MVKFVKTKKNNQFGVVVDEDKCGSWVKLRNSDGLVCLDKSQYVVVSRSGVNQSSNMQLELVKALKNAMLMAETQVNMTRERANKNLNQRDRAKTELEDAEQQDTNAAEQLSIAAELNKSAGQIDGDNNEIENFKHKSLLEYLSAKENKNKAAEALAAFNSKYVIYVNRAAASEELAATAERNLENAEKNLDNAVSKLSIPERIIHLIIGGRKKTRRR